MAKHAERPRVRRCVATRDAIYILRPVIEAVYVADQTLGKSEIACSSRRPPGCYTRRPTRQRSSDVT